MSHAIFVGPDLTMFIRLDVLGLRVTGRHVELECAVLACWVVDPDQRCRRCGCQGVLRGTSRRRLTAAIVTVRRYRCSGCGHVWRHDTSQAARPRAKLWAAALRWVLVALVVECLTIARIAEALAVLRNVANDAVLAEGQRLLTDDPTRLDGVITVGVDEHVWRHVDTDEHRSGS